MPNTRIFPPFERFLTSARFSREQLLNLETNINKLCRSFVIFCGSKDSKYDLSDYCFFSFD